MTERLWESIVKAEKGLVQDICEQIGYGRTMQLAERLWNEKMPGAAHSVGPCAAMLVPCPNHKPSEASGCDWCCGSGRVTKRVARAIEEARTNHEGSWEG